MIKKLC